MGFIDWFRKKHNGDRGLKTSKLFEDSMVSSKERMENRNKTADNSPEYTVHDDNHISIKVSDNPNYFEQYKRIFAAQKEYEKQFGKKFPQTVSGMKAETEFHNQAYQNIPSWLNIGRISKSHANPCDIFISDKKECENYRKQGKQYYPELDKIEEINDRISASADVHRG